MARKYLVLILLSFIMITCATHARNSSGLYGISLNYTPSFESQASWSSTTGINIDFMQKLARPFNSYESMGYEWAVLDTASPYKKMGFLTGTLGIYYDINEKSVSKLYVGLFSKIMFLINKEIKSEYGSMDITEENFDFLIGPSFIYSYPINQALRLYLKGDYLFLFNISDISQKNTRKTVFNVNLGLLFDL